MSIIAATCATLLTLLATAQGGDTLQLTGVCPKIKVTQAFPQRVTIDATRASVAGVELLGANITWRGGILTAAKGMNGIARDGYAAYVEGQNITISGVTFTDARNGVVVAKSRHVGIHSNTFWRLRNDGVNASQTYNLAVTYNRFLDPRPIEPTCDGVVTEKAARDCPGVWKDGDHAGGVQLRDNVVVARLTDNVVEGNWDGGLSHNDRAGYDAAIRDVLWARNAVNAPLFTAIQAQRLNCIECRIERNIVRRPRADRKSSIFYGAATHCGNEVEGFPPDQPCS